MAPRRLSQEGRSVCAEERDGFARHRVRVTHGADRHANGACSNAVTADVGLPEHMTLSRNKGVLALTFIASVGGCGESQCPSIRADSSIDGTIFTGGDADTSWPSHSDGLSLIPPDEDSCRSAGGCTTLWHPGATLGWNTPPRIGTYALGDLDAELCETKEPNSSDAVWTCVPLLGTLTVLALPSSCQSSPCDLFEADVSFETEPPAQPHGLSAVGQAHLLSSQTTTMETCGGGSSELFGLE
jgi:hypothetical protein